MGLNDILHIARSGMSVSQTAIRTTGNNISNASTPGYSRQRVNIKAMGSSGSGPGLGAAVADIHRVHDSFLERQSNMHRGSEQFLAGQNFVAIQLETVFNELEDSGINSSMNDFFNSFKDLSLNAASMADRQMVVYKAEQMANRINTAYTNLEQMQSDLNSEVEAQIDNVNALLNELGNLNQQIAGYNDPSGGNETSTMLDRRDAVVRELHEMLDVTSFTDDNGSINIMLANNTLVEGVNAGSLKASPGTLYGVELTSVAGRTIDITSNMQSEEGRGYLSGIINERDVVIEEYKADLDQLAYTMAEQVNLIHSGSFALDGTTGRNFFDEILVVEGAAKALTVNSEIVDNAGLIAAAEDATALSGDNRSAMAIAALADDKSIMTNGSFSDFFTTLVGDVSTHVNHVQSEMDYQSSVVAQSDAYKNSISGVSIDEEMVNLIQYQRSFEAAAKMIQTVDELLSAALSLKS